MKSNLKRLILQPTRFNFNQADVTDLLRVNGTFAFVNRQLIGLL